MNGRHDGPSEDIGRHIFYDDPLSRFRYESVHGIGPGTGADPALKRLMLAVLEEAIACIHTALLNPFQRNQRLRQEAEEWISADDDGVFSFANVCETLGYDPQAVRAGLEHWTARQAAVTSRETTPPAFRKQKTNGNKQTSALRSAV